MCTLLLNFSFSFHLVNFRFSIVFLFFFFFSKEGGWTELAEIEENRVVGKKALKLFRLVSCLLLLKFVIVWLQQVSPIYTVKDTVTYINEFAPLGLNPYHFSFHQSHQYYSQKSLQCVIVRMCVGVFWGRERQIVLEWTSKKRNSWRRNNLRIILLKFF